MTCFLISTFAIGETHLGITYSQIADQTGFGLTADTEFNLTDSIEVNANLNGQNTGSIYRGKLNADVSVPVAGFDVGVSSETKLQGYVLSELGHDTTYGLKASKRIGNVDLVIGVFGANAGEWGPPNAFDILVDQNNFEPEKLEGLGLENLTPAKSGLSIKNGSRLNLRFGLNFNLFDDKAEVSISGRPEIGSDENPVHQLITAIRTGVALGQRTKVVLQGELGVQTWYDELQREFSAFFSLNYLL